ncbi:hypothetical protein OE749_15490 [Aestuariibacter sp. AA17]|uniref:Uncharacterized protein n=1 Tax=Fluctibacter corallii TaxID=2984329 RepID=A0ABT3ABN7_9ALTE|nr:hypothetical protein [Aestuariibacter sp. AA17]MCV2886095.1 hypothetical protein [Aestuariibacter sp. AA17]
MSQPEIKAEKINSPIQLMAAWFVMLILLSGVLLTAASQIQKPDWASGYLIIFTSILIIGVVLYMLLMLTKFRPNLQDGKEYAQWLKDQNRYSESVLLKSEGPSIESSLKAKLERIKAQSNEPERNQIIDEIENSVLYEADIANLPDSNKVVSAMEALGLSASIYDEELTNDYEVSAAIWLGANIPPSIAVPAIKKAASIWPQLKYIHLSSDGFGPEETHWSIFLGGSTATAVNDDKLKPWTVEEINNLEVTSVVDFHNKIRAKYP